LLSGQSPDFVIDFNQRKLPPRWVDIFDKTSEDIQQLRRKVQQLKKLQTERMKQ